MEELNLREKKLVLETLEQHHRELLGEIMKTDDYDYREALKSKAHLIGALIKKLRLHTETMPRSA